MPFIYVITVFIIIGLCGWLVQRPLKLNQSGIAERSLNLLPFFGAFLIWVFFMGLFPDIPVMTIILIGGPIAFFLGFAIPIVYKCLGRPPQ